MKKTISHKEFLLKLYEKNEDFKNGKYNVISTYKNSKTKIKISTLYGVCEFLPTDLLRGKIPSINSAVNKDRFFQKLSEEKHGIKYNYNKVNYKDSHSKIIIECPIHGEFIQKPYSHLNGRGCYKCHLETSVGWKWETWEIKSKNSIYFDSFKVYIIKCWDKDEFFYKIGRTFTTIERRFRDNMRLPYNYEIVKIYDGTAKDMVLLENKFKKQNKSYKYIPKTKFKGFTECYKKIIV